MYKSIISLSAAIGLGLCASLASTQAMAEPIIVVSPSPLPLDNQRPRVFMGGSIDMGGAPDWQAAMIRALSDMDVVILNPRRPDWNPAWKPEASEPEFRRQVEWELAALEASDVIVMYFAPGTQSPISLLEMGLHARSGKLIVLAPDGFWRKGNVDITAEAYGVHQVQTMEELTAAVRDAFVEAATKGRFAR
ncbi:MULTISPECIES: nucleoside 2-deoxyribosyltransferase domain-containing protein [unclassified Brevundimonas]|uniref:nucleoside 2-deoxyribosyltransferase domain-containing protein n=1 Tax=unclassified Brevundimonas TaxID=2622653 RepID=UPI0025C235FD|nr:MULTISPECIES: nucleoside 2-deoxyribosyltransferase domain-containing protein [unclassified Brevundimonas]